MLPPHSLLKTTGLYPGSLFYIKNPNHKMFSIHLYRGKTKKRRRKKKENSESTKEEGAMGEECTKMHVTEIKMLEKTLFWFLSISRMNMHDREIIHCSYSLNFIFNKTIPKSLSGSFCMFFMPRTNFVHQLLWEQEYLGNSLQRQFGKGQELSKNALQQVGWSICNVSPSITRFNQWNQ